MARSSRPPKGPTKGLAPKPGGLKKGQIRSLVDPHKGPTKQYMKMMEDMQMPWNGKSFQKHNQSLSPEASSHAAEIANAVLENTGDEGMAIAVANKNAKQGKMAGGGKSTSKPPVRRADAPKRGQRVQGKGLRQADMGGNQGPMRMMQ